MEIETADDRLQTFFQFRDFAIECVLSGPAGYTATILVIRNAISDPVTEFDTTIEAWHEHFIARVEDVAGVDESKIKQYTAALEGETFTLTRITHDHDGKLVTVYLKT